MFVRLKQNETNSYIICFINVIFVGLFIYFEFILGICAEAVLDTDS